MIFIGSEGLKMEDERQTAETTATGARGSTEQYKRYVFIFCTQAGCINKTAGTQLHGGAAICIITILIIYIRQRSLVFVALRNMFLLQLGLIQH